MKYRKNHYAVIIMTQQTINVEINTDFLLPDCIKFIIFVRAKFH